MSTGPAVRPSTAQNNADCAAREPPIPRPPQVRVVLVRARDVIEIEPWLGMHQIACWSLSDPISQMYPLLPAPSTVASVPLAVSLIHCRQAPLHGSDLLRTKMRRSIGGHENELVHRRMPLAQHLAKSLDQAYWVLIAPRRVSLAHDIVDAAS